MSDAATASVFAGVAREGVPVQGNRVVLWSSGPFVRVNARNVTCLVRGWNEWRAYSARKEPLRSTWIFLNAVVV